MFLIKNHISEVALPRSMAYTLTTSQSIREIPTDGTPEQIALYSDSTKYMVIDSIAKNSQTFILDTPQAEQFLRSIDRKLAPNDYPLPFECMCIQFSGSGLDGLDGKLQAILLSVSEAENMMFVVAWYADDTSDLVVLPMGGDGSIDIMWEEDAQREQRIANLALLILAYLNTPNMSIELVATDPRVNRQRQRNNKRVLEDYYVCRWNPPHRQQGVSTGTGSAHSIRYDVAGHFRRLPDGRTIWIRSHQRGLQNERYVPKVYRVG